MLVHVVLTPNKSRLSRPPLLLAAGRLEPFVRRFSFCPAGRGPPTDDSGQCPKSVVDFSRRCKRLGHIRLQHYDIRSCRIARCVFASNAMTEIVSWTQ